MEKFHPEEPEGKARRIVGPNELIRFPAVKGFLEREPVRITKLGDKIIVESSGLTDAVAALERIEREGLPGLGLDKGGGFIDLETRRIDKQKVEIRFYIKATGNVRKSVPQNQNIEEQNWNDKGEVKK